MCVCVDKRRDGSRTGLESGHPRSEGQKISLSWRWRSSYLFLCLWKIGSLNFSQTGMVFRHILNSIWAWVIYVKAYICPRTSHKCKETLDFFLSVSILHSVCVIFVCNLSDWPAGRHWCCPAERLAVQHLVPESGRLCSESHTHEYFMMGILPTIGSLSTTHLFQEHNRYLHLSLCLHI